jgi:L-seryl-tRNA(Ser) seleniumtransferase
LRAIPIWQMTAAPPGTFQQRAEEWMKILGLGEVVSSLSTVGGGSLPDESLATFVLALSVPSPNRFLERLRRCHPAVIARLEADKVIFDPRTVLPEQEHDLLAAIRLSIEIR